MQYQQIKERHREERDGYRSDFSLQLPPLTVKIMMKHLGALWGKEGYPVVAQ